MNLRNVIKDWCNNVWELEDDIKTASFSMVSDCLSHDESASSEDIDDLSLVVEKLMNDWVDNHDNKRITIQMNKDLQTKEIMLDEFIRSYL